jgi:emp24/gp25L/p24 family/GOLD
LFLDLVLDKNTDGFGPVYITVNTVPSRRILDTILHESPVKSRLKPTTQTIQQPKGSIIHRYEVDGIANICFRASAASRKHPQRFGIHVESSEQDPRILLPSEDKTKDGKVSSSGGKETDVDAHLSNMEKELQRITLAMNHVLKEADFNRDQDAIFHKQTLAMHSATTFWPIVQVSILLITGFTQANHIVRFFKSRRII